MKLSELKVFINGYSQSGSSCNTLAQGTNAVLKIELSGSNYPTGIGLFFDTGSDGSILSGLVVNEWIGDGIVVLPTASATISNTSFLGNFVGTDVTGTIQKANGSGIFLESATNTRVGTPALADRNLVAGSFLWYVGQSCVSSLFGQGNSIVNNLIGTDKTGTQALGNSQLGIYFIDEYESSIGGATISERNIISGHLIYGIFLQYCESILIQNNYIGTDVSGTIALPNGNAGIESYFETCWDTISNNLISGNGIGIQSGTNSAGIGGWNIMQNNLVGTDASGLQPLGNTYGLMLVGDVQDTVAANVISGNDLGLVIYGQANGNTVTNNLIGTNKNGTKVLPNNGNGIQIGLNGGFGGASDNTIGS